MEFLIKFLKPCDVLFNYKVENCECCGPTDWWDNYSADIGEEIHEDLVNVDKLTVHEDFEYIIY